MVNETSIKDAIMKLLGKSRGFWYRAGASAYSRSGISDIMGVFYGVTVAIEVKTPAAFKTKDNGRTKNQSEFLQKVNAAGGIGVTVCSVHQVSELLKQVEQDLALRFGESWLAELR